MPRRNADDAVIPLSLLDAVLDAIGGVIHDRPVQSLVAARLMIETAIPPADADPILQRGVDAVTVAAQQSRDIMWAMQGPQVIAEDGAEMIAQEIAASVARAGNPDTGVHTSVSLDDEVDPRLVQTLMEAVHAVAVAVMFAGGQLSDVAVLSDAETVQATVVGTAARTHSPWLQVARARLASAGGVMTVQAHDGLVVGLSIPRVG